MCTLARLADASEPRIRGPRGHPGVPTLFASEDHLRTQRRAVCCRVAIFWPVRGKLRADPMSSRESCSSASPPIPPTSLRHPHIHVSTPGYRKQSGRDPPLNKLLHHAPRTRNNEVPSRRHGLRHNMYEVGLLHPYRWSDVSDLCTRTRRRLVAPRAHAPPCLAYRAS